MKSSILVSLALLLIGNLPAQVNVHTMNLQLDSAGLSEEIKTAIIRNYINVPVGGWLKFNMLAVQERKDDGKYLSKLSKERCNVVSSYLKELEVEDKDIVIKYEPYAFLWVFKAKELQKTNCKTVLDSNLRQCFLISKAKGGTVVTAGGISFYFPPYSFDSKGTMSDKVDLCIWEYASKEDFVMNGMVARSKGRILESMGMFYVEAKCEGVKLQLKQGYLMNIIFPKQLDAADGYFTFNGNVSSGLVDWKLDGLHRVVSPVIKDSLATQKVEQNNDDNWEGSEGSLDGVYYEGEVSEQEKALYSVMQSSQLGWINCDRFYETRNKVNIACELENGKNVQTYLVFKDINSILPLYSTGQDKLVYAKDLPADQEVIVISFGGDKNNFMLGYTSFNTSQKEIVKINIDPCTTNQFKATMSDLLAY
ncbi:MAG: hypothetical protein ACKOXB_02800 [Flavobacteriales bacterium]